MRSARKKRYGKRTKFVERMNVFLCFLLVLIVIPVFITIFWGRLELEELVSKKTDNSLPEIEAQLPQMVAKQINILQPDEVIKAQSVIARTNLMSAKAKGEEIPASFSIMELQNLWGERFEDYYERLQQLVAETAGETLQYNGNYIYAAYHQTSAGNTRTMKEYHQESQMPYLQSVNCHEDTTAEGYLNVFFWTRDEFIEVCKSVFPETVVSSGNEVCVQKRDAANYVLEVQAGQSVYEGEEFRKRLGLPSSCFEITMLGEDVRIVTLGSGHGFGMSQHMAGYLSENGYDYKEILKYFFKDVILIE